MSYIKKIDYIIRTITQQSYESDQIVLGNVNSHLMCKTKQALIKGIDQDIAVINGLHPRLVEVDKTCDEDIIFEYFWGMVYEYLNTVPLFKELYMDSETEKKLEFFKNIIESPLDIYLLEKNKDLFFTMVPDRIKFFMTRNYFKIGILNYQAMNSDYLLQTVNSVIRTNSPHIPIFILTEGKGLKSIHTNGDEWIHEGNDFHYYNVETGDRSGFVLEKRK